MQISVIVCCHNPRGDHLRRTLKALEAQSLSQTGWELILLDNASSQKLESSWDLSWHKCGRHIREARLGLTRARLRGISEAEGELLVFVDADNVLAPTYLGDAAKIASTMPQVGVFGAGVLEPEFEVEPERDVEPWLGMLALRSVSRPLWTNNVEDHKCGPFGAGLCVPRTLATAYMQLVEDLNLCAVLGRTGERLLCADDDLFRWVSSGPKIGFGIFPELRILHLMPEARVKKDYLVRLVQGHAFSHSILNYLLEGTKPAPVTALRWMRLIACVTDSVFLMRCKRAAMFGESEAVEFIRENQLQPLGADKHPLSRNDLVEPGMNTASQSRNQKEDINREMR